METYEGVESVFCSNHDGPEGGIKCRIDDDRVYVDGGEIQDGDDMIVLEEHPKHDPTKRVGILANVKYDDGTCEVENDRITCRGEQGTTMRKAEVDATLGVELEGAGNDMDAQNEIKSRLRRNFDSVEKLDVYVL
jgi:hypothetical protein